MVRRVSHLFERVWPVPQLHAAWRRARRGKATRRPFIEFAGDLEERLWTLSEEIRRGSYRPSGYDSFTIYDPKRRVISRAPVRDRVVHQAVGQVLLDVFLPRMVPWTFACLPGRGTHRAAYLASDLMARFEWVARLDVVKFFPSVSHDSVMGLLERKVKDQAFLGLASVILESGRAVLSGEVPPIVLERFGVVPRGLPIGNYTSQVLANVVLMPLDRLLAEELRVPAVRYCDDLLVFGDDRERLARVVVKVEERLAESGLLLHAERAAPRSTHRALRWLGYRLHRDHRTLPPDAITRFVRRVGVRRRALAAGAITPRQFDASVAGWLGHAVHARTLALRQRLSVSLALPALVR